MKLSHVRKASSSDREGSWSWVVVMDWEGAPSCVDNPPSIDPSEFSAVYAAAEELAGVHVRSAGQGGPGQRYANEPWVQWFPKSQEDWSSGWLIVSQSGGLDI